MVQVFEVTAYDKCTKDVSFDTYIAQGVNGVGEKVWCDDQLAPFHLTDNDIHMYFEEGELDGCSFIDTEDFFYLIGEEIIKDDN